MFVVGKGGAGREPRERASKSTSAKVRTPPKGAGSATCVHGSSGSVGESEKAIQSSCGRSYAQGERVIPPRWS